MTTDVETTRVTDTDNRFPKVRNPQILANMVSEKPTISQPFNRIGDAEEARKPRAIPNEGNGVTDPEPGCWDNSVWQEHSLLTLSRMTDERPSIIELVIISPPWNLGKRVKANTLNAMKRAGAA